MCIKSDFLNIVQVDKRREREKEREKEKMISDRSKSKEIKRETKVKEDNLNIGQKFVVRNFFDKHDRFKPVLMT